MAQFHLVFTGEKPMDLPVNGINVFFSPLTNAIVLFPLDMGF